MTAKTLAQFCVILYFTISAKAQHPNNVCTSLEAYYKSMVTNPKCWYDVDVDGTPKERAQNNGFLLEEHQVTTEDGYILPLYRLKNLDGSYGSQPIFLQHGLTADASALMLNKENSLSFYLAGKGYDVWLGNYRGCEYCSHATLTSSDPKYWDFSFHEHGLYDLPANFEYIQNVVGQKIIYIGHSMGSTGIGIYASVKPMDAEKYIKHAILLAPAIHFKPPNKLLSTPMVATLDDLLDLLPAMGYNALLQKDSFELLSLKRFFFSSLDNGRLFMLTLSALFGTFPHPLEPEKVPAMLSALKVTPLKSLKHYLQNFRSGEFRMFDYGPEENMMRYGTEIPPNYDLNQSTLSMSLVYGQYDPMASKDITVAAYEHYHKPNWDVFGVPHNHVDFLFSSYARKTILPLLSKIIGKVIRK